MARSQIDGGGFIVRKRRRNDGYKRTGRALAAARVAAGMSEAQFAARLHKPQSFVSKYELGLRRLDVIEFAWIAACLNADAVAIATVLGSPDTAGPGSSCST